MRKYSTWRQIAGVSLGLLAGLLFPVLFAFSQFALLTPVILAVLWAWAGLPGACATAVASLGMCYFLGSPLAVGLAIPSLILPGFADYLLLRRRKPFTKGVYMAVSMQLLGLLITVAMLWLVVRGDIVTAMVDELRYAIATLPTALVDQFLILMGRMGALGTSIDFSKAVLTVAERAALVDDLMNAFSDTWRLGLPAMLLCSGIVTAIFGYALPMRICTRRGDDPPVVYAPLHTWRLTPTLVVGPFVSALCCYVAYQFGLSGADSAYLALLNMAYLLFAVQGVAALDRLLRKGGVKPGIRALLLVPLALFGQVFLRIAGVYSALFGSEGLATKWLKKWLERKNRP